MISSSDVALLMTAWATGFLGGTHCIGMCGGICAAFSFALPAEARSGWRLVLWHLAYNGGRILTYTLLGLIAGLLAHSFLGGWAESPWPRLVAGIFMILLGLYLAGWSQLLQKVENLGSGFWRSLAPLRKKVLPVDRPWKAILAGGLWGFLPCGLVYSALTLAITRSDPVISAATMLAFGLGTLPFLLITGTAAGKLRQILQGKYVRQVSGILVILFGVMTIFAVMKHASAEHGSHTHSIHESQNDSKTAMPEHAHEYEHEPDHASTINVPITETHEHESSDDSTSHQHLPL